MKTEEQMSALWDQFEKLKSQDVRNEEKIQHLKNQIAGEYYGLVRDVAKRIAPKLKEITAEECESYGVDGLYEAIEKYDRTTGNQFRTFAPHRIRGAILDNIRKVDWVPRLVRQRNTVVEKYRQSYFMKHGRYPSDEEMATSLEFIKNKDKYDALLKNSLPISMMSMNNKTRHDQDEEFDEILNAPNCSEDEPDKAILRAEMFMKLLGKDFTRLERKIVYLVYYEGLTMKEVAKQTNFSESRISQMHGDILKRLRSKMQRNPEYANELEKLLQSSR